LWFYFVLNFFKIFVKAYATTKFSILKFYQSPFVFRKIRDHRKLWNHRWSIWLSLQVNISCSLFEKNRFVHTKLISYESSISIIESSFMDWSDHIFIISAHSVSTSAFGFEKIRVRRRSIREKCFNFSWIQLWLSVWFSFSIRTINFYLGVNFFETF